MFELTAIDFWGVSLLLSLAAELVVIVVCSGVKLSQRRSR